MKRLLIFATLWMAPLAAGAVPVTDFRAIGVTLSSASPTYTSTRDAGGTPGTSFDLTSSGVPLTASVVSAALEFALSNTDGLTEIVAAFIEGYDLGGAPTFLASSAFSAFGGDITGSISVINSDGILDYTLAYFAGNSAVTVESGTLRANVVAIPEPGTLALLAGVLALGLVGIGVRSGFYSLGSATIGALGAR